MGWLVLLAGQLGRLNKPGNLLILSAAVMIGINPKILRDDIGFQLSFLAVFGLFYLAPYLEKRLSFLPSTFYLKESLVATISAQIITLPIMIFNFGQVSLIAPIANLLVLPLMPPVMIVGLPLLFLGVAFSQLAFYLFWPIWLILSYVIFVVEILAEMPYASWHL